MVKNIKELSSKFNFYWQVMVLQILNMIAWVVFYSFGLIGSDGGVLFVISNILWVVLVGKAVLDLFWDFEENINNDLIMAKFCIALMGITFLSISFLKLVGFVLFESSLVMATCGVAFVQSSLHSLQKYLNREKLFYSLVSLSFLFLLNVLSSEFILKACLYFKLEADLLPFILLVCVALNIAGCFLVGNKAKKVLMSEGFDVR